MASSNRHWPSMFKSKPCNPHHQWQHELHSSLLSGCQRNPYTSGVEAERSPEPKPRWNPKPEQIQILEAIFNSGMVNPPRDEIRKIRAQLQEYGNVGDANVFYWFQNRKSRSKLKSRQQLSKNQQPPKTRSTKSTTPSMTTNPSSSSSSSDMKSSPKLNSKNTININMIPTTTRFSSLGSCSSNFFDQLANSPATALVGHDQLIVQHEPFAFPNLLHFNNFSTQGSITGFPDHYALHHQQQMIMAPNNISYPLNIIPHSTDFLLNHPKVSDHPEIKDAEEEEKLMMMKLGYATAPSATNIPNISNIVPVVSTSTVMPLPSALEDQLQDQYSGSLTIEPMKSTVFINEVAFEVNKCGLFPVREAFGNDAVLLHSSGQPVMTDDWGVTLQPLQHGASYYLF